jgi:hypothetical protein
MSDSTDPHKHVDVPDEAQVPGPFQGSPDEKHADTGHTGDDQDSGGGDGSQDDGDEGDEDRPGQRGGADAS